METSINDGWAEDRNAMVREQIAARGVRDARVLDALRTMPRHRFVPPEFRREAYADRPLPIGQEQTISQPYIVALMTESLDLAGDERALEVGAGSGYQSAVLARLCRHVTAIERHADLAARARRVLDELGVANVDLFVGDGSRGWPDDAPYDVILAAACAPAVPPALVEQLRPGGRLVLPVAGPPGGPQRLRRLLKRTDGSVEERDLGEVGFVPLIGAAGYGLPENLGEVDL